MFKRTPVALLKFVARAGLNAVGFGLAGDIAVDVLPEVARDIWERWHQEKKTPAEIQAEIKEAAALSPEEAREQAHEIVEELAGDQPTAVKHNLELLLTQVPVAIRQSQRCPADPSGRTVSLGLTLAKSDDVLQILPSRLPHFQPGDRPPGLGDWELDELLGVGGFGEVWRAKNPYMSERVALKFCLDQEAAKWLRHEAALLDRVKSQGGKHEGIVALLDTYLGNDPPCLKYEYVAGGDLTGLVNQWRHAPPADRAGDCARLMRQLADVMAFVHRLDPPIVHRDLKPANILLEPAADGGARVRVADFGIGGIAAKRAREEAGRGATSAGVVLKTVLRGSCTPLYASKQQQLGDDPDPRDDVYSLGVIWFQLLTGDLSARPGPDWRADLHELGVSAGVLRLIENCISDRAERRPVNAAVLLDELTSVCGLSLPTPRPKERGPEAVAAPAPVAPRPPATPRKPPPPPRSLPRKLTNSVGMEFVLIPAGTFLMGSPEHEVGRRPCEGPLREVSITRPFYLGVHPVTQAQFQHVQRANPSHFGRRAHCEDVDPDSLPVERVPWGKAVLFCRKLGELQEEREHGRLYRLPTEAEWEYACRGDSTLPFHFGASLSSAQANFDGHHPYGGAADGPYLKRTSPVGSYPASPRGLFDLHGNVWEWCQDWYGASYYGEGVTEDPKGPDRGERRVVRGGAWDSHGDCCRSAHRGHFEPDSVLNRVGFRVLLEAESR